MGGLCPLQLSTENLGLLLGLLNDATLVADSVSACLDVDLVLANLLEQPPGLPACDFVDVGVDLDQFLVKRQDSLLAIGNLLSYIVNLP